MSYVSWRPSARERSNTTRRKIGLNVYAYRMTSGSPTSSHWAGLNPRKSEEPMSPRSFPRSAIPTHSYGMPIGARVLRRVSMISLHESREPPGVAWSFPNGSMSTRYTFHRDAHSRRQLSFPFVTDDVPSWPHFSHLYRARVPSIPTVFAPIFPHASQKASKGIHPCGYGRRERYLFTRRRTSSARAARARTIACISGVSYACVVVTIRTSDSPRARLRRSGEGAKRSRTPPKSTQ